MDLQVLLQIIQIILSLDGKVVYLQRELAITGHMVLRK